MGNHGQKMLGHGFGWIGAGEKPLVALWFIALVLALCKKADAPQGSWLQSGE